MLQVSGAEVGSISSLGDPNKQTQNETTSPKADVHFLDESAEVENMQYNQDPAESSPLMKEGKLVCTAKENILTFAETARENTDNKDDETLVTQGSN